MRRCGKNIALLCVLVVIMAAMVACGRTAADDTEIISSKNIEKISVELFDKSERTFEGDAVSSITEMMNKATLIEKKSVQDTPDSLPFGTIKINEGEEVIYYYQKNDRYYIEKPYTGIYETTVDINAFLQRL